MGMTTMSVVTVLIREKSIICVMDERWLGRVYSHRLLLVNTHAQNCQFILYRPHVVYQEANWGRGGGVRALTRVGGDLKSMESGGSQMSFLPPTGSPPFISFCSHFKGVQEREGWLGVRVHRRRKWEQKTTGLRRTKPMQTPRQDSDAKRQSSLLLPRHFGAQSKQLGSKEAIC